MSSTDEPTDDRAPTRDIRTLLIANRGEIARRIIRTAREMGIRTIGVYSEPDRLAPHVQEADVAVPIGGYTASDSYLNHTAILDAAAWQGADAIHPGYGFLSESSVFAKAVVNAGITWVGPSPRAIRIMGDKVEAKRYAETAGVPTLPSVEIAGDELGHVVELIEPLGYPVLIKAAAGGGGKGMRLVSSPDDLEEAVLAAQREAASSFGNGLVFAERWLPAARHIEIQVFADEHGQTIHLGERECSIQRRHQKIIEESPSPAISPEQREAMGRSAIALARSVDYVGAGTVEFLVPATGADDGGEGEYFFLEMNTRLQVEHPVTEAVTGLDLVRLQLDVARGEPLGLTQDDITFDGHAIEARLYAEDPANDWMPSTGRIHRWRHGPTPGIRYDDGVASGATVTPYYDPMLSKAIVHAPTRREAAARLGRSLRELHIHGVTTNRDYLVDILGDADFLDGRATTSYVDEHPPVPSTDDPTRYEREWQRFNAIIGPHLAAAALAEPTRHATSSQVWPFAPTGWRNVGGSVQEMRPGEKTWRITQTQTGFASQTMSFLRLGEQWDITYSRVRRDHPLALRRRAEADAHAPSDLFNVTIGGPSGHTTTLVELIRLDDEVTLVHFGRRGHRCTVHTVDGVHYVNSALGQSVFHELPRFPEHTLVEAAGGPTAPVPGRVVAVNVEVGDDIEAGQTLVVLEAMKVEHQINAASAARVSEVLVSLGDNVDAHQLLVRLEEAPTS